MDRDIYGLGSLHQPNDFPTAQQPAFTAHYCARLYAGDWQKINSVVLATSTSCSKKCACKFVKNVGGFNPFAATNLATFL